MSNVSWATVAAANARGKAIASKAPNAFSVFLAGIEVKNILSARLTRAIDAVAAGWTAEIPWTPAGENHNPNLDAIVGPYQYPEATVYLGSNLVSTGRLYTVTNNFEPSGLTKTLEGFSFTADLVDSHISREFRDHIIKAAIPVHGYTWTGGSVWNLANSIGQYLGIGVKTDIGDVTLPGQSQRTTAEFSFLQAALTESYAEFLARLAYQRGLLVTTDVNGNLFLTAADLSKPPVATLGEGDIRAYSEYQRNQGAARAQGWKAKFDGRKRYYKYTVYGQSGWGDLIYSEAIDPLVPKSRIINDVAPDGDFGVSQIAAQWTRSKQLVEALSIPFPVIGWYTPRGQLWAPNTLVQVFAPSIHVNSPFTFLVRAVEYIHEQAGQTATLSLVPPQCYTGDPIKEPWVKS